MTTSSQHAPRNVTIFGGLGFIGRHTVAAFQRRGDRVVIVDAQPNPAALGDTKIITATLDEHSKFNGVLKQSDVVICLASSSLPATANADMAAEIKGHVESTVALAQACANADVSDFLFASSGGTVYGPIFADRISESSPIRPINAYGASKAAVEGYLRVLSHLHPIRTRSLRISNPYGVGQDVTRKQGFVAAAVHSAITQEVLTIWGDGSAVRDFVHVSDVARAFVAASLYQGAETDLNIGSGVGRSLIEVVNAVEQSFDTKLRVRLEENRAIDVPTNVLDIDLAVSELDWHPSKPMDLALKEMADEQP